MPIRSKDMKWLRREKTRGHFQKGEYPHIKPKKVNPVTYYLTFVTIPGSNARSAWKIAREMWIANSLAHSVPSEGRAL
jgi:hypothetical protein